MASYITGRTAFHCFRKCGYSWKGFILPQLWITGVLSYFYKLPRRQWNALDCHLSVLEGQLRTHKKFKSCHNRRDDSGFCSLGQICRSERAQEVSSLSLPNQEPSGRSPGRFLQVACRRQTDREEP